MAADTHHDRFSELCSVRAGGIDRQREGDYEAALSVFQQTVQGFKEIDEQIQVAWTTQNTGLIHELLGQTDAALAAYREAERLFRDNGERLGWPLMLRRQADCLRRMGRLEEALSLIDEGIAAYGTENDPNGIINSNSSKAAILLELGRADDAAQALQAASEVLQRSPRRACEHDFLFFLRWSETARAQGKPDDEVRNHARQARTIADLLRLAEDQSDLDVTRGIEALASMPS